MRRSIFFWEITLTFGSTHADAVPRDRAAAESSANSLELRAKNCEGVMVGRFVCVCVWFFSWFHFRGPMGLWPGGQAKCLPHMRPEKLIRRRDSCGQPFCPMRSEVPVFFLGGPGSRDFPILRLACCGDQLRDSADIAPWKSAAKEAAKCHKHWRSVFQQVQINMSFPECPTEVSCKSVARGC